MSQQPARQSRAQARSACRSRQPSKRAVTLQILRDVARAETALGLEWWSSYLLGELWRHRSIIPPECEAPWELVLGAPILADIAAVGGRNAALALRTLARFDRGELGWRAFELACELHEAGRDGELELPDHLRCVGRATITRAEVTLPDPDGEALLLESRCGDADDLHTLAVFIDGQLGWIAKRLRLIEGLDEIEETDRRQGPGSPYRSNRLMDRVALDPAQACGKLRDALQRTDLLLAPPVGREYAHHRALALSRACSLV